MIRRKRSLAALVLCLWLAESDVTACHQSRVWIYHIGDIIMRQMVHPSTVFDFLIKISDKCKSTSPSALQVKNWQKTIGIE